MEALLVSAVVVSVAEIGDRTQLLSMVLASRYRKPIPILCGILVATLANHALAGLAGEFVGRLLGGAALRWALGFSFLAMAVWTLIPDTLDEADAVPLKARNAFLATTCSFFIAEIGDKTEIATAALAARFDNLVFVVIGTTIGMMIANFPAVLFGHLAGHKIDPRRTRVIAAVIFAIQGVLALSGMTLM
jgi:putative Ca2+/H+ antiporter (TMEM165/GDT1 family)